VPVPKKLAVTYLLKLLVNTIKMRVNTRSGLIGRGFIVKSVLGLSLKKLEGFAF